MFWCNTFARLSPILAGILLSTGLKGRTPNLSYASRVALFMIESGGLVLTNKTLQIQPLEKATLRTTAIGYPLAALFVSLLSFRRWALQKQGLVGHACPS